jgi:hypothetical protein
MTATIIGASLSTAAIVGIVIAASVIGCGAAGGSVYAAMNRNEQNDLSGVTNNPLYSENNAERSNPLYNP